MHLPFSRRARENRAAIQRLADAVAAIPPIDGPGLARGVLAEIRGEPKYIVEELRRKQTQAYAGFSQQFSALVEMFHSAGELDEGTVASLKTAFSRNVEIDFFDKIDLSKGDADALNGPADALVAHAGIFEKRILAFREELNQISPKGTAPDPQRLKAALERIVAPITPSLADVGGAVERLERGRGGNEPGVGLPGH